VFLGNPGKMLLFLNNQRTAVDRSLDLGQFPVFSKYQGI
jgi:hypothetical protein